MEPEDVTELQKSHEKPEWMNKKGDFLKTESTPNEDPINTAKNDNTRLRILHKFRWQSNGKVWEDWFQFQKQFCFG